MDCTGPGILSPAETDEDADSVNKDLNNTVFAFHYTQVERYSGRNEGDITIGLLPEPVLPDLIIPFQGR